nr:MAG TPA: hypothetical protein [Caudoviricetes sp.]
MPAPFESSAPATRQPGRKGLQLRIHCFVVLSRVAVRIPSPARLYLRHFNSYRSEYDGQKDSDAGGRLRRRLLEQSHNQLI